MSGEINHHEPKLEQVINVTIICPFDVLSFNLNVTIEFRLFTQQNIERALGWVYLVLRGEYNRLRDASLVNCMVFRGIVDIYLIMSVRLWNFKDGGS